MMRALGIDTSNYTTSVAIYESDGSFVRQEKLPLPVQAGQLGLRQSDAVFGHIKQLPALIERILPRGEPLPVRVGYTVRPRDVEGSYMPCFLPGGLAARSVAAALGVKAIPFSHQAGHIAAALWGAGALSLLREEHLAFHASGGTTECLLVRPGKEKPLDVMLLGATADLCAGQLIDRVARLLGLPFPGGPALEAFAAGALRRIPPRATLKDRDCCLSGLENQCKALLESGEQPEVVAAFAQESVGATICGMALAAQKKYPGLLFVFAGGVMSNGRIRTMIQEKIANARFAPPELSADNAVGIALLAALWGGNCGGDGE